MNETLNDKTKRAAPRSERQAARGRAKALVHHRYVQVGALVVLLIAVGTVTWVALGSSSSSQTPSGPATTTGPVALSANGLHTLAGIVGQPIYWAGPKKGYLYELTRTKTGSVFIRYLPPEVKVGSRKPQLTIATYRYPNALQALKNVAHGREHALAGGGIALVDTRTPKSIHVAYPHVGYQVDVFDPSASRAQRVAFSGSVRPIS